MGQSTIDGFVLVLCFNVLVLISGQTPLGFSTKWDLGTRRLLTEFEFFVISVPFSPELALAL